LQHLKFKHPSAQPFKNVSLFYNLLITLLSRNKNKIAHPQVKQETDKKNHRHVTTSRMGKGKRKLKDKGAALRSKKRQKEHLEELQEEQADKAASQAIFDKPNEQLFVLDGQQHGGDVTTIQAADLDDADAAKQKQQKLDKKNRKNQMSELDRKQIEKLVSKHSAQELQAMAEAGRKSMEKRKAIDSKNQGVLRKGRLHKDFREAQNYDLWAAGGAAKDDSVSAKKTSDNSKEEAGKVQKTTVPTHGIGSALAGISPAPNVIKAKTTTSTMIAASSAAAAKNAVAGIAPPVVDTIHAAGQSYRPEPVAHSKLLKQAVDIELRRNQAEKYLKTPICQGLSEETKAYMIMESSSDESSSDEEEDVGDDNDQKKAASAVRPVVRTDKLTRAQRNKKKRTRRAIQAEEATHKERKRLRHEFAQLPKFAKDLKKQEFEEAEKRKQAKELQEARRSKMSKTEWATLMSQRHALSAPTLPVALPSELHNKKKEPTPSATDKNTASAGTTTAASTTTTSSTSSSTLRTLQPKGSLVSMTTDRMMLQHNGALGKKQHEQKRDKNQRKRRRVAVQNKGTSGADFTVLG
jgi:nucleolar protein 53